MPAAQRLRPRIASPAPPPTTRPPLTRPETSTYFKALGAVGLTVLGVKTLTSKASPPADVEGDVKDRAAEAAQTAAVKDVMSRAPPPPSFTGLAAPQPVVEAFLAPAAAVVSYFPRRLNAKRLLWDAAAAAQACGGVLAVDHSVLSAVDSDPVVCPPPPPPPSPSADTTAPPSRGAAVAVVCHAPTPEQLDEAVATVTSALTGGWPQLLVGSVTVHFVSAAVSARTTSDAAAVLNGAGSCWLATDDAPASPSTQPHPIVLPLKSGGHVTVSPQPDAGASNALYVPSQGVLDRVFGFA